jgi:hypothetical protein
MGQMKMGVLPLHLVAEEAAAGLPRRRANMVNLRQLQFDLQRYVPFVAGTFQVRTMSSSSLSLSLCLPCSLN